MTPADLADTIIVAVRREYPNAIRHVMRDERDRFVPSRLHPAFYGCYDWHSAVAMHWALAALVRHAPAAPFAAAGRAVLGEHLSAPNLAAEAAYLAADPGFERPYGWGWLLALAAELAGWAEAGDPDAAGWSRDLRPLAEAVERGFVTWLPRCAHPDRSGTHGNSAFALTRALPWAFHRKAAGSPALHQAISDAAVRWFDADAAYPTRFEPGGADFLSPALSEAVLMIELLTPGSFPSWYEQFVGEDDPYGHFERPARVTDADDGQGAHLVGLNLHRAHALRRLARRPDADADERARLVTLAQRHLDAAAPVLAEPGNWMHDHWLPAFAVLALREAAPGG